MTETTGAEHAQVERVSITLLIPVFNDWKAAELLVDELDEIFGKVGLAGEVVFVDDGSLEGPPRNAFLKYPRNLGRIRLLELRKNVGHQRALCIGLVFLQESHVKGPVLVMDADGEDAPSAIPQLLQRYREEGGSKVVFAERGRRAEGILFKTFYHIYRMIHWVLVGFDTRVGNFSVLDASQLERLVVSSDLWNHYAAAIIKARIPCVKVRLDRAKRLSGSSTMDFVGLVAHGLSAMSVFGDVVGTRLLLVFAGIGALAMALIGVTVGVRLATNLAIPGWATYTAGLLLLLLFQSLTLALVFTFVVLSGRGQSNFVPVRDCPVYLRKVITVYERQG